MNDYKELIECLKIRSEYNRNGNFWNEGVSDNIDAAIKAIEQLVKERDELKEVNILLTANSEHFKRERDAAIADLKTDKNCDYCKWLIDGDCTDFEHEECHGEHWEWRGVQNDT